MGGLICPGTLTGAQAQERERERPASTSCPEQSKAKRESAYQGEPTSFHTPPKPHQTMRGPWWPGGFADPSCPEEEERKSLAWKTRNAPRRPSALTVKLYLCILVPRLVVGLTSVDATCQSCCDRCYCTFWPQMQYPCSCISLRLSFLVIFGSPCLSWCVREKTCGPSNRQGGTSAL